MSCFKVGLGFVVGFVGAFCLALLAIAMFSHWLAG